MDDTRLREIFETNRTIAVVGFSSDPERPGHYVPEYLAGKGYRIIPVNPRIEGGLGEKVYPDLASVPEKVDIVEVFRRPEHARAIVEEAARIGAKVVWMQDGAGDPEAAKRAEELGMTAVVDDCMLREHRRLFGE